MLALGAPDAGPLGIDMGRIEDFADRDQSEGKQRTALLVAGLAGLGRIDARTAGRLSREYRLGTWRRDELDAADRRGDAAAAGAARRCCWPRAGCRAANSTRSAAIYLFHADQCAARAPARNIWRG